MGMAQAQVWQLEPSQPCFLAPPQGSSNFGGGRIIAIGSYTYPTKKLPYGASHTS